MQDGGNETEEKKGKLLLVDGNAIMHRAFHAIPDLTDRSGAPINAVYGFFSMILNVIKDFQPTHVIVCFDVGKPTFRQEMYAGYHEHRPPMKDGLVPQMQRVREVLESMHVQVFAVAGYEGDDMIGTLSVQAVKEDSDMHVVILTGDRDLLQLINPRVRVVMPVLGVKNVSIFDEEKVEEKYGVTPQQFIDYKALIGDQSDGYPGVAGIGPKTASSLLKKYQTFENLYQSIDTIEPKLAGKLATDAEQAALAKKLATIITDAPITIKLDEAKRERFDLNGLRKSFETLGFNSLLKRFEKDFIKAQEKGQDTKKDDDDSNGQLGLL